MLDGTRLVLRIRLAMTSKITTPGKAFAAVGARESFGGRLDSIVRDLRLADLIVSLMLIRVTVVQAGGGGWIWIGHHGELLLQMSRFGVSWSIGHVLHAMELTRRESGRVRHVRRHASLRAIVGKMTAIHVGGVGKLVEMLLFSGYYRGL